MNLPDRDRLDRSIPVFRVRSQVLAERRPHPGQGFLRLPPGRQRRQRLLLVHRFAKRRYTHATFLRLIDREVPAELDIHLVLDNYATHKHAKVKQWLAARRFHLHFTPTYASWLNQVERWFGLLSQRAIKSLTSDDGPVAKGLP